MRTTQTKSEDECGWETIRLLEVGGKYFAFQQLYKLYYTEKSKHDGGLSNEKMPQDEHRLKPLNELVDMDGIVDEVMGDDPVDEMTEL